MLFSRKIKVMCDTNTLMLLNEGVDIFTLIHQAMDDPYELYLHQTVLSELERLMQEKSKRGFAAKLAYVICKQKALKTIPASLKQHPDDALVEASRPKTTVIATQDKDLIKRLQAKGVRVLRYYKGRFHLQ